MRLLVSKRVQTTLWRYLSKACESVRKTETKAWEPVIGLEIHAQISANSKLFSGSSTGFGAPINNSVSFFDASLPGTLPVLNKACVTAALKTAISLNCLVNRISYFDRKHYFYADLPAGYQITQKRLPIATKGHLIYPVYDGKNLVEKMAHLTQIQLEQDSGKSIHDVVDKMSLIDLNRAGIGLMEIITEPDFRSATEAMAFVKELQLVLQTIGSCNAKMEEGSMRVDASISVRKPNEPLGVRTEVKNLNSIRSLGRAVAYEIDRQIKSLENGIAVENQTMFYDSEADCTIVLRDKEKVHDYRFLPEPNLVPLHITEDLQELKKELPVLPRMKRDWLMKDNKLTLEQSFVLVSIPGLFDLYKKCSSHINDQKLNSSIANFCTNEILTLVNKTDISLNESDKLDTNEILEIVLMLYVEKTINLTTAKKVLEMLVSPTQGIKSARDIVEKENMKQLSDISSLTEMCQELVLEQKEAVKSFKAGNKKIINFLIGQVQKKTGGRANGRDVAQIFQDLLTK